MPVLFRRALRPQCPVRRPHVVVCFARSCLQIGSRCVLYPPYDLIQRGLLLCRDQDLNQLLYIYGSFSFFGAQQFSGKLGRLACSRANYRSGRSNLPPPTGMLTPSTYPITSGVWLGRLYCSSFNRLVGVVGPCVAAVERKQLLGLSVFISC